MKPRSSWHPSEKSALLAALSDPETQPLDRALAGSPSEAEVRRIWQKMSGRMSEPKSRVPRYAFAFGALAATLCVLVLVFWLRAEGTGPLLAGNAPLPTTLEGSSTGSTVVLSDNSRIRLEPETRLDVLGNDKRTFVTTLRRGKAVFEVEPGGPRRWVIEAGLVSVEVVGTIFTVSRDDGSVTVSVERGIVLVRGEIAGSERRLTAGQSLVARGEPGESANKGRATSSSRRASLAGRPEDAEHEEHALALEDLPDADGDDTASEPLLDESDQHTATEALDSADGAGPANDAPTLPVPPPSAVPVGDAVDQALSDADAARRLGDVKRAAKLYEKAAERAPVGDPRRGMAALSYARLSANPARAAILLEASQTSMPPALAEAALAHLAEAHGRAGHAMAADAAARRYLATYPHHPRTEKVKRWLASD
jgi:transmembrane sensor